MGRKSIALILLALLLCSGVSVAEECLSREELQQQRLEAQQAFLLYRGTIRKLSMDAIIDYLEDRTPVEELEQERDAFAQLLEKSSGVVEQHDPALFDEHIEKAKLSILTFKQAVKERKDLREIKIFVQDYVALHEQELTVLFAAAVKQREEHFLAVFDTVACTYTTIIAELDETEYDREHLQDRVDKIVGDRTNFRTAMEEIHQACGTTPIEQCREGEVFDFKNFAERVAEEYRNMKMEILDRNIVLDYERKIGDVEEGFLRLKEHIQELEEEDSDVEEQQQDIQATIHDARRLLEERKYDRIDAYLDEIKRDLLNLEEDIQEAEEAQEES